MSALFKDRIIPAEERNDEAIEMKMKHENTGTRRSRKEDKTGNTDAYDLKKAAFYHFSVRADHRIFANEADRQVLLRMLGEEAGLRSYEIVAFAVLDDEMEVLLVNTAGNTGEKKLLVKKLVKSYEKYYRNKRGYSGAVKEEIGWSRVRPAKILDTCDRIHQLPAEKGYVSDPSDYWFSSLNQYREKYQWHFLNIWWIAAVKYVFEKPADQ